MPNEIITEIYKKLGQKHSTQPSYTSRHLNIIKHESELLDTKNDPIRDLCLVLKNHKNPDEILDHTIKNLIVFKRLIKETKFKSTKALNLSIKEIDTLDRFFKSGYYKAAKSLITQVETDELTAKLIIEGNHIELLNLSHNEKNKNLFIRTAIENDNPEIIRKSTLKLDGRKFSEYLDIAINSKSILCIKMLIKTHTEKPTEEQLEKIFEIASNKIPYTLNKHPNDWILDTRKKTGYSNKKNDALDNLFINKIKKETNLHPSIFRVISTNTTLTEEEKEKCKKSLFKGSHINTSDLEFLFEKQKAEIKTKDIEKLNLHLQNNFDLKLFSWMLKRSIPNKKNIKTFFSKRNHGFFIENYLFIHKLLDLLHKLKMKKYAKKIKKHVAPLEPHKKDIIFLNTSKLNPNAAKELLVTNEVYKINEMHNLLQKNKNARKNAGAIIKTTGGKKEKLINDDTFEKAKEKKVIGLATYLLEKETVKEVLRYLIVGAIIVTAFIAIALTLSALAPNFIPIFAALGTALKLTGITAFIVNFFTNFLAITSGILILCTPLVKLPIISRVISRFFNPIELDNDSNKDNETEKTAAPESNNTETESSIIFENPINQLELKPTTPETTIKQYPNAPR